jgi:hypothetical protein
VADYCWQCTIELGAAGEQNDFSRREVIEREDAKFAVLCEGCGWIVVDLDGRCLHIGEHPEFESWPWIRPAGEERPDPTLTPMQRTWTEAYLRAYEGDDL